MLWIHIINNSFENIGLVHYQSPFSFSCTLGISSKRVISARFPTYYFQANALRLDFRHTVFMQMPCGQISPTPFQTQKSNTPQAHPHRIKAACENGTPAYYTSSVYQTHFPFPHAFFDFSYDYLVLLKRSYLSGEISTTVFSPSTICASISPTLGAVPKPCPVKAQARIRPGTSSTGLITGTPS